jgi:excinuclease UvrABC nuclease subunit
MTKNFKKVKYFFVKTEDVNETEADMIVKYTPVLNSLLPTNDKWTYLSLFQRHNPCLKGKMTKIKQYVKKFNISYKNGFYLVKDLTPLLEIINSGEKI